MTTIDRLEYYGNQLAIIRSDGKRYLGVDNGNGDFIYEPIPLSDKDPEPTPDPGGNPAPEPGGAEWQWPFQYSRYVLATPLAQYGMRQNPVTNKYTMHWGLDFGGGGIAGQPIPAAAAGTVTEANYNGAMGNHVVIEHPGGFRTRYFHMVAAPAVKLNQQVTRGQTLGNVGSTGNSTGAHLHWETYENGVHVNPRDFMKHRGIPET